MPKQDFAQLALNCQARFPIAAELWTRYRLGTCQYPKYDPNFGAWLAYHFDRDTPIQAWLKLVSSVQDWVDSRPELHEVIEFVPFDEVGKDFFAQRIPPYDGGYPTTRYEEFLFHGTCEPAPWFYHQLAELHGRVAEAMRSLGSDPMGELMRRVVHATFIRPYDHLFWLDEQGWAVYQPNITADDVQEWTRLEPK